MEVSRAAADADCEDIAREAKALAGVLADAPGAAVAACPGWDVDALAAHTGSTHRWATANAAGTRTRMRDVPGPPEGSAARRAWFDEGVAAMLACFAATDPDLEVWTFAASGERRAGWWMRRMAGETAVHRWDAQRAAGAEPDPIPHRLAVAGIAEHLLDFLPRVPEAAFAGLTGTLHLHVTDGGADGDDGEWLVDLDHPDVPARPGHARADTAVRGPAEGLLLWLWNRRTVDEAGLEVLGDPAPVGRWTQIAI